MKRLLLALLLLVGLAAPSLADVQIAKIAIEPGGGTASVRVKLLNQAVKTQKGPIVVKLYARKGSNDQWTLVNTWNDIDSLGNGETAERTWQGDNDLMRKLVAGGKLTVKVAVSAPDLDGPVEMRQQWKKSTGP